MVATTSPPSPQPRQARPSGRQSADGQILGGLLVLGGVGWFLQQINLFELSTTTTLSCLLIALGLGMVLTARRAGGIGLVFVGLALVVALASATAVDIGLLQHGVGDRVYTPVVAGDLQDQYRLGAGQLTLDLRAIDPALLARRHLEIHLGFGELVVLLPSAADLPVDVQAEATAGEINLLRPQGPLEGTNVVGRYRDPGARESIGSLELDLGVGLGAITVQRPPR